MQEQRHATNYHAECSSGKMELFKDVLAMTMMNLSSQMTSEKGRLKKRGRKARIML